MKGGLHFFLGADGASFAFLKEEDEPDWSSTIDRAVAAGDLPDTLPTESETSKYLDTSELRSAVVKLLPTDDGATYTVTMYGYHDGTYSGFDPVHEGTFKDVQGSSIVGVNVHLVSGLFVFVDALDTGTLELEWAPVPYETPE